MWLFDFVSPEAVAIFGFIAATSQEDPDGATTDSIYDYWHERGWSRRRFNKNLNELADAGAVVFSGAKDLEIYFSRPAL